MKRNLICKATFIFLLLFSLINLSYADDCDKLIKSTWQGFSRNHRAWASAWVENNSIRLIIHDYDEVFDFKATCNAGQILAYRGRHNYNLHGKISGDTLALTDDRSFLVVMNRVDV